MLAQKMLQKDISGFEELSGIPGTIGGAVVMNAGAHGKEMKDVIIKTRYMTYDGKIKTLQHEKDQVKEVKKDMDCGMTLENCQDYKEKDIIEVYELVEIKR